MSITLLMIVVIYSVTLGQLISGFRKIKTFHLQNTTPKTHFSVVVPFRNEAENLPRLLQSIEELNYPLELFEIILVDDASSDGSERIVYQWRMNHGLYHVTLLENIRRSGSPKKDAIARAIPIALGSWILTTDADCSLPKEWLSTLDAYIQKQEPEMIAAPVMYEKARGFLGHFQQLDLASLQAVTIGSFGFGLPFMANAANLGYTKKLYYDLGGFEGSLHQPGGDDVFLLQKAAQKFPEKVHYLKAKQAIVKTQTEKSWRKLLSQRIRWAAKASSYTRLFGRDLALMTFAANLALVLAAVLGCAGWMSYEMTAAVWGLKIVADYLMTAPAHRFLTGKTMWIWLPASVLYPVFCTVVALASLIGTYRWKGRDYKV